MLDRVQSFYGLTRMPFGRDLGPGMPHRHHDHAQATARIAYGINTPVASPSSPGEVGVGETVAALDRADRARHHARPEPVENCRGSP
jgi:type II secretory pathway predicted ATPase ExeA